MGMNNIFKDNMSDSEIRILGEDIVAGNEHQPDAPEPRKPRWMWMVLAALLAVIAILGAVIYRQQAQVYDLPADSLAYNKDTLSIASVKEPQESSDHCYVVERDTVVNDIALRIFEPMGGKMDLYVGKRPEREKGVFFAVHAADMRGDTHEPAGAFVYKGEVISKGHSKYGFCAIIGDEITIGRQTETPLFERAIEQNGSFFRQYSIVSNGKLVIVPPKGKAIRRALCLIDGKMVIVETRMPESYLNLAQALVDIHATEALSVCGASIALSWQDEQDQSHYEGEVLSDDYEHENYIIWRSEKK